MVNGKTKLSLSVILILTLLLSFSPITILSASQPIVELQIDKTELQRDDIFVLGVNLSDFTTPNDNIGSFQVDLMFDSAFIEPQQTKVTYGDIYNQWKSSEYTLGINKVENGLIQFATSNYNGAKPFNGDGVLYSIPFKVLKSGKTEIKIKRSIFVQTDKPGIEVPHSVQSIALNILGGNDETPAPSPAIPSQNPEQGDPLVVQEISKFVRVQSKKIEEYKDFEEISKLDWAVSSIRRLSELGIFTGGQDNNFRPRDLITRAEFATVLARALELEKATTIATTTTNSNEIKFNDVEKNEWFNEGVTTVAYHQLMVGRNNNGNIEFAPKASITRGEIATILVRALHLVDKYETENLQVPFSDIPHDWSREGILIAYHEGLIKGKAIDKFEPASSATRAEVAVMITRLIDYNPIGK